MREPFDLGAFQPPEQHVAADFVIRCYRPGDGPLLAEGVSSSYEHLRTYMPWARPRQGVARSERLASEFRLRYQFKRDFTLGVFAREGRLLLGGTGFHMREEGGLENLSAEIGMWIPADRAHRGLGTAVLRELLAWGFREWPWERLGWRCAGSNAASRRVALKAGMTQEGILREHRRQPDGRREDTICFSMLRREWQ